jgi:hypothetical protein
MSGVRARWHLASLDLSDDGPFEDIGDMGVPLDLTRPDAVIQDDIARTLRMEAMLHNVHGVECDMKAERSTPPCWSCPHFVGDASPMGRLCALGRSQADLVHEAETARRTREAAVAAELAEVVVTPDFAAGRELAEAVL